MLFCITIRIEVHVAPVEPPKGPTIETTCEEVPPATLAPLAKRPTLPPATRREPLRRVA